MPWARIDDMLPVHPKVTSLSDAAFRLFISAICWSNMHHTDGRIPAEQLRFIAAPVKRPQLAIDQLVLAGLWEKNGTGWLIHDYLDYQPSADKVRRERDAKKQRQERWLNNRDASGDGSKDASGDGRPIPSHPIPSPEGSVVTLPTAHSQEPPDGLVIRSVQDAMTARGIFVTAEQARATAARIIGDESVRNPSAYVSAAIMRDPNPKRFIPPTKRQHGKPPWCGVCDKDTRLTGPADAPYRCPACHPITAESRKL